MGFVPRGEAGCSSPNATSPPRRQTAGQHQWRLPFRHAFRHIRRVRSARFVGKILADGWAKLAVAAYKTHRADRIVAERNNGGDMVQAMIRMVDPMSRSLRCGPAEER